MMIRFVPHLHVGIGDRFHLCALRVLREIEGFAIRSTFDLEVHLKSERDIVDARSAEPS